MSAHRFFLPAAQWTEGTLTLRDEEAHHCTQVVRCAVGDRVAVFDGQGREAGGSIDSAGGGEVVIGVRTQETTPPDLLRK